VLTVTGIKCLGRVSKGEKLRAKDRWGPVRIAAKRMDKGLYSGDIRAIGWK
jgi:hypothetical protein